MSHRQATRRNHPPKLERQWKPLRRKQPFHKHWRAHLPLTWASHSGCTPMNTFARLRSGRLRSSTQPQHAVPCFAARTALADTGWQPGTHRRRIWACFNPSTRTRCAHTAIKSRAFQAPDAAPLLPRGAGFWRRSAPAGCSHGPSADSRSALHCPLDRCRHPAKAGTTQRAGLTLPPKAQDLFA